MPTWTSEENERVSITLATCHVAHSLVTLLSDCSIELLRAIIRTAQPKIDHTAGAAYMGESE
jgi:hypothetical protein